MVAERTLKEIRQEILSSNADLFLRALIHKDAKEEIRKVINQDKRLQSKEEQDYAFNELVGLGFFEDLIGDDSITDIGFNGKHLFIDNANGKYEYEGAVSEEDIIRVATRFAQAVNKEFTPKRPILDAQLDNMRINAVHKSISRLGTTMSIRMARAKRVLNEDNYHLMAPVETYDLLRSFVEIGSNVMIAGEVGTGKTELTKLLAGFIPNHMKTIMIEDVLETHLKTLYPEKDILSWLVTGTTDYSNLIKAGLRNNPDYLIISEVRGEEASDFYDGILSSHSGITSIHAMSVRAIEDRFINMIRRKNPNLDVESYKKDIYRYFDLAIHIEKTVVNGKVRRYISEIAEYTDQGLKTLYKQTMKYNHEASYNVHFGRMSQQTLLELSKYGVECQWNEHVLDLYKNEASEKSKYGYKFIDEEDFKNEAF